MKKLLLVSTALVGVAMLSSPASAAVKLDLGGFFRGYGVYADNNEPANAALPAAQASLHNFEFRRDSEIHVQGETTLDNGLTIGAMTEMKIGNGSNAIVADETYGYASGGWGRFNLGVEDGAAYLLQVAAPSADSNVDGLRVNIQALNPTQASVPAGLFPTNTLANSSTFGSGILQYAQSDFRNAERLTYLTPKFSGFQGGVSYAPQNGFTSNIGGMSTDRNSPGEVIGGAGVTTAGYNDLWEASARYDGEFQGVGINLGAGYSDSSLSQTPTTAMVSTLAGGSYFLNDGVKSYNFGANLAYQGFSLGGGYMRNETRRIAQTLDAGDLAANEKSGDITRDTWVVGLGYDNGPYHVGASYLDQQTNYDAIAIGANAQNIAATKFDAQRYTVGGGYTFGPGMTFRGAVAWGTFDAPGAGAANDNDFTQVTVGTDVEF
ncbi:MAG: porin [Proteobacteria bacterium]|nr:porin [Pseudomonadota bacterium]